VTTRAIFVQEKLQQVRQWHLALPANPEDPEGDILALKCTEEHLQAAVSCDWVDQCVKEYWDWNQRQIWKSHHATAVTGVFDDEANIALRSYIHGAERKV
jgi:hypothetical protein